MSQPTIFLSYAREDRPWAEAVAEALRGQGLSLWFDEWEVKPGDNLRDALDHAFRESEALVLLVGPESIGKPTLFFELGAALALGKRIILVVSEEVERSRLPVPLRHLRYLVRKDPEETAEEVARAVA